MSPANENHSIEARHLATMLVARAMLAALKVLHNEVECYCDSAIVARGRCGRCMAAEAIAQAKTAGIEAPAHVIAASSDLAKGDAP